MKRFLKPVLISVAALMISQAANALPRVLILAPSTDMIGAGRVELGYESMSQPLPFHEGRSMNFYGQYGLSDRLEIGTDLYDFEDENDVRGNVKYLVTKESDVMPAIAVGCWDIGEDTDESYYVTGSKTYDKVRFTFGAEGCEHTTWGLAGLELTFSPKITFVSDYASGHGGYASVGLRYNYSKDLSALLYYSCNNSNELRSEANFMGLLTTFNFSFDK